MKLNPLKISVSFLNKHVSNVMYQEFKITIQLKVLSCSAVKKTSGFIWNDPAPVNYSSTTCVCNTLIYAKTSAAVQTETKSF